MIQCKECRFFKRGKWHKSVDPEQSDQASGSCKVLAEALKMYNDKLWATEELTIGMSFGCCLGKPKTASKQLPFQERLQNAVQSVTQDLMAMSDEELRIQLEQYKDDPRTLAFMRLLENHRRS